MTMGLTVTLGAASALGAAVAPVATPPPVMVYPSPGDRFEQRATQISFRGIPAAQIGSVQVVGSRSGIHAGQIEADSDGEGASFVPSERFAPGETVTVTTGLNIVGGDNGLFRFRIDHPRPYPRYSPLPHATAPNDLQHFYSAPGLIPAAVRVTENRAPASEGDIFVAPQYGPAENGPMILDPGGRLIWFRPYPIGRGILATDFRTQNLDGQRVLTWWQGNSNQGSGRGVGMIYNDHYERIATVHAGNGLHMDLHEFRLTPNGDAYIVAVAPVHAPHTRRSIENGIVQEIDVKTGLVLFQWDALDHIPLSDSVKYGRRQGGHVLDPYHINSVSVTGAGNLVVSFRNTNAVYGISRATGRVIWTLGGRHSSFRLGGGVSTAFQHDAVVQRSGRLTIFDDGAGPPTVHSASRGIEVNLNFDTHRATLVRQWFHSPNLSSSFEGSLQRLEGGDAFLGWGQQPYFSEVNAQGHQIFDAHFVAPSATYRAYRLPWSGHPNTRPAIAVVRSGSRSSVYASWNGATAVSAWRVVAGATLKRLHHGATRPRHGFETGLPVPSGVKLVAVQALDARGHVLATSRAERVH
jgi:hypothetical protein